MVHGHNEEGGISKGGEESKKERMNEGRKEGVREKGRTKGQDPCVDSRGFCSKYTKLKRVSDSSTQLEWAVAITNQVPSFSI